MRVGIVLGAGGVVGASWLIGALEALEDETGFKATEADHVVGTSAGAVVGSLTAAGLPASYMASYMAGRSHEDLAELEDAAAVLDVLAHENPDRFRLQLALPPIGPGSWRMALSTLRHPLSHSPAALLSGWLPRGVLSTAPIRSLVDRFVGEEWPEALRVVACDYRTGRRVAFGDEDAPTAGVSEAVAASCAIPAFYHPVAIDGRRYVDGGLCSMSNLDLLIGEELDVAICLNPTSSATRVRAPKTVGGQIGAVVRGASNRRLAHEVRKLEAHGTRVVVLQPSAADLAVMGTNLMSRKRRAEVTEQAHRSVARHLRSQRSTLPKLGAKRRRPVTPAARPLRAAA
jgi:NTE family protein